MSDFDEQYSEWYVSVAPRGDYVGQLLQGRKFGLQLEMLWRRISLPVRGTPLLAEQGIERGSMEFCQPSPVPKNAAQEVQTSLKPGRVAKGC